MATPTKPKKLKRKSNKFTLRSSSKAASGVKDKNVKRNTQENILGIDRLGNELSSFELANELEKQYEINEEKNKLVDSKNLSHAISDLAQSLILLFEELKLYQEFINQEHPLDSLSFKALKRIRQYLQSLFKNDNTLELILINLKKIDTLDLNDAKKAIFHYLNIIQQFKKIDNNDSVEYLYLKDKLPHLPKMLQSFTLKKIFDLWNKYKQHITSNQNKRKYITNELNKAFEAIKQNEKIINDISYLQKNNELSKILETISNISQTTQDDEAKKHLLNIKKILSHFQSMFESYIDLRIKSSHSYNLKAQKKIHQLYKNILDLHESLDASYHDVFSISSPQPSLRNIEQIYETAQNIIKKNISFIEMTIQNSNATLACEKAVESGIVFIASDEIKKDSLFYKKLNLGMLSDFTPSKIMNMALDGLSACQDPHDINNALYFIYLTLQHDSQNISISYEENNDFIQRLSTYTKEKEEINSQLEQKIKSIFAQKKEEHKKKHLSFLEKISSDSSQNITPQAFSRYILQHLYHLKNSEPNIKNTLCNEFSEWMKMADSNYFSTTNKNFGSPYYAALLFIQEAKNQNIDLSNILMLIDEKTKFSMENEISSEEIRLQPISKFHDLLISLEKIANGELNLKKENFLAVKLVHAIEQSYDQLLNKIETHELAAAGNLVDKRNIKNELYSHPQSIHINKLQDLKYKISALLSALIVNKYNNRKISAREKVKECKKITGFYIKMMNQSFQNKQYNAFSNFFHVLSQNSIKKFITNQEWDKQYDHFFTPNNDELCRLIERDHTNPTQIPFVQRFMLIQENDYYNFIAKYITISNDFLLFKTAQEILKNRNISTSHSHDLSNFSDTYLFNCTPNLCEASYLSLSINLDNDKFQEYINERSEEILPTFKPEEKLLIEFETISDLYHHLNTSHNREWGYHLLEKNASANIMAFIINKIHSTIQEHKIIPNLKEIFSIIKIVNEIETSLGNSPVTKHKIYKKVFDAYYDALDKINTPIKKDTLENFEETLHQSKDFLNIIDNAPSWFESLSAKSACYKSAIKLEDKLYELIESIETEPIQEESSMANLLNSILSGGQISIFGKKDKSSLYDFSREMSRNEYWITSDDLENVGLSETFLSLSQKQQSILSKFSDESLQNQFVDALHWSKTLPNIKSISSLVPIKNPNLLNTDLPLERKTQLSVIRYLLILFDMLGKLCGRDGMLVLKNYDAIDKLINDIEKLQFNLLEEYCHRKEFNNILLRKIRDIQAQNNQLYIHSKQDSQGFFITNEIMNNFCHLNERIAHQLLDIPFNESVLAPQEPSPPHAQLISEATINFGRKNGPQSPKLRLSASSEMELSDNSAVSHSSKSTRHSRKW